jgi:hypothetical protein
LPNPDKTEPEHSHTKAQVNKASEGLNAKTKTPNDIQLSRLLDEGIPSEAVTKQHTVFPSVHTCHTKLSVAVCSLAVAPQHQRPSITAHNGQGSLSQSSQRYGSEGWQGRYWSNCRCWRRPGRPQEARWGTITVLPASLLRTRLLVRSCCLRAQWLKLYL